MGTLFTGGIVKQDHDIDNLIRHCWSIGIPPKEAQICIVGRFGVILRVDYIDLLYARLQEAYDEYCRQEMNEYSDYQMGLHNGWH